MTTIDAMELLRSKVAETSQAEVGRQLGYSGSTISQILSGKYPGDPATVLQRVVENYGGLSVDCPVLGEISLALCCQNKRKPYESVTNPAAARLYRACRHCPHNGGKQ